MVRFQVVGKVVEGVDLLRRRHWAWRLDCWPFALLYSVWIFVALPSPDFTDACILLWGLSVFHILGLLFTSWSVDFRCFIQFTKAMITGDQALTACHVASQVNNISKPALILAPSKSSGGFKWVSPDETETTDFNEKEVESLSESHDHCIGGDSFEMLQRIGAVIEVIPYGKVFARVASEQMELILTTFKSVGRMTLMCGDGTNDVGALKQIIDDMFKRMF